MNACEHGWDLAPCAIVEFQDNGVITQFNSPMCRLLGYSKIEFGTLKFDDLLTTSSRIFHQTHFFPLLRLHGHAEEIFLTMRHKDETAVPVLANATRRTEGGVSRIVCALMGVHHRGRYEEEILLAKSRAEEALQNNEELRRSREQLEERLHELDSHLSDLDRRNRQLFRFSQIVSHDLREPLRKITGFTSIIRDENDFLTPAIKAALDRIDAGAVRAQRLLRTIREFLDLEHQVADFAPIRLAEVVEAARVPLDQQLRVTVGELPEIHGSRTQLTTLFVNLFRSAIQRAGAAEPVVHVAGTIVKHNSFRKIAGKYHYVDFAQIAVSDNCKPFDCADADSIFELLRKVHGPEVDVGLAVCQRIVENHDGSISVRCPPGRSPTFIVLLPMHHSRNAASKSAAE